MYDALTRFVESVNDIFSRYGVDYISLKINSLPFGRSEFLIDYGGKHYLAKMPRLSCEAGFRLRLKRAIENDDIQGIHQVLLECRVDAADQSLYYFTHKFNEVGGPYIGLAYDRDDKPHLLSPPFSLEKELYE